MELVEGLHNLGECSFCNLFSSISFMMKQHMSDHVKKHFSEKLPNACITSKPRSKEVVVADNTEDPKDIKDSIEFLRKEEHAETNESLDVRDEIFGTTFFNDKIKIEKSIYKNQSKDKKDIIKCSENSITVEYKLNKIKAPNSVIKTNNKYQKKSVCYIDNNLDSEKFSVLNSEDDMSIKKTKTLIESNHNTKNNMDNFSSEDELNISLEFITENKNMNKNESSDNNIEMVSNKDSNKDDSAVNLINNTFPKTDLPKNSVKRPFDQLLKEYYTKEGHSFKCNICSDVFYTLSNIKEHVYSIHKENHADAEHICNKCDAKFLKESSLKNHYFRHEPAVTCEKCEKTFSTKLTLVKHQKLNCRYLGSQDLEICEICGKGFKTRYHVKMHYKQVHLNLRSFKCSICDKIFQAFYHFQTHCLGIHKIAKDEVRQHLRIVKPDGELTQIKYFKK